MRVPSILLRAILAPVLPLCAQTTTPATHQTTTQPNTTHQSVTRRPTAKPAAAAPAPPPMTDDDKVIYAIGLQIAQSLGRLDLSSAETDLIRRAIADNAAGKPAVQLSDYQAKIGPFAQGRSARSADKAKVEATAFTDKAAAEPGAVKSESGMIYKEITPGTGASPKPTDTVKVNYRGTLTSGTEFDSSYSRNEPASFPLNGVIPCWTEGLQKMKVGGKARLVCPSSLAYGDAGRPGIPPGAALVFEIELLDVSGSSAP